MNINDLLKLAVERKASDLHLKVGSHPMIRVDGHLTPMPEIKRMMQEDTMAMGYSIMNAAPETAVQGGARSRSCVFGAGPGAFSLQHFSAARRRRSGAPCDSGAHQDHSRG